MKLLQYCGGLIPPTLRFPSDKEKEHFHKLLAPTLPMGEVTGMAKIKFSGLMELGARARIKVSCSKLFNPTDIYFFQKTSGNEVVVGELVYEFVRRYKYPNTYDYCWFVAWMNGLDRPFVSMG